jgi:hypothetical protein
MMRYWLLLLLAVPCFAGVSYPIVDTGQGKCYDAAREIAPPAAGAAFYGQDGQVRGTQPAYQDNGDGTISDLVTGLMWVKARGEKVYWNAAMAGAKQCRVGGYTDWRMPTIKELYSLINFTGGFHMSAANSVPYLDTRYFEFRYGNEAAGERGIDCQDWTATTYVSTTMLGNATVFGVNFADGRIKGYPKSRPGPGGGVEHTLYARYVRGNPGYGKNDFRDNGDGTVTDRATGLMWTKADSGTGLNWQQALAWVQEKNTANFLGHRDWRLPNAKELQSIVDYTRSPDTSRSAAIDPVFTCTPITNEGGAADYPFYWTGTSHLDGPLNQANAAIYLAFGRALGWMGLPPGSQNVRLLDVHGAGAQRSDPKTGNPASFPHGRGPQGDVIRIYNYVRCVREAK